jgi:carbon monoxide dehydrogenase subunit G
VNKVECSVVVDRPLQQVFDYLTEPANLGRWQSGIVETKSAGKLGLGSTFVEVRSFLGQRVESTLEVTEYVSCERFSLRVISGPWLFEVFHRFTPAGEGTRVEVTFQGETKGYLRVARAMLERAVRSELEESLAALKDVVEAGG